LVAGYSLTFLKELVHTVPIAARLRGATWAAPCRGAAALECMPVAAAQQLVEAIIAAAIAVV
jgi:hypothetical protein